MAPTAIECTYVGCSLGVGGAKWRTPEYELEHALKMLEMHMVNHVGQAGQLQRHRDGGSKS